MDNEEAIRMIVQDEVVRMKIRKQLEFLERKTTKGGKIWAMLNSAFSLWILSTILVGIFTWAYSNWAKNRDKDDEIKNEIEKIDTEISYRLDLRNENALKTALCEFNIDFVNVVCLAPAIDNNPMTVNSGTGRYIFPEFKERNIFSLLWELERLVSKKEKQEIEMAKAALEEVRDCLKYHKKFNTPIEDYIKRLKLERWII